MLMIAARGKLSNRSIMVSYTYWSYFAKPKLFEAPTFSSEIEEGSKLSAFVVAPQQVNRIFKLDLDCQDQPQHLDREAPPVHIISEENVLSGLERASGVIVDHFDEVVELTMDVAHDCDGVLDLDDVGFLLCVKVYVLKMCLAFLRSSRYSFLLSLPSRL